MHPFNEPMIVDPNTVVNHYSWERNSDAIRAFMNTNRDVMTDPMTQMVSPQDATQESEVVDMKPETDTPEGADEGQTGDQGGDADGQNFGQDQGSQDTMEAESVTLPIIGTVSFLTIGVIGVLGYLYMKRGE